MNYDIQGSTTVVELAAPSTLTTTAANAYGTVFASSELVGQPLAIFHSAGTPSTGGKLTFKVQNADLSKYTYQEGDDDTGVILREGATVGATLAATFTPTAAGSIRNAYLKLKKTGTITATKYIQAKLMTDNSSVPSNTVLDISTTSVANNVGTAYAWVNFTFTSLPELAAETAYWLILMGDYDVSGDNCVYWAGETVASGGTATTYSDSWEAITDTTKFNFRGEGYAWTDTGLTTVTTGTGTITEIPVRVDDLGANCRGAMKVTAGDGSTSFRCAGSLVARRKYG